MLHSRRLNVVGGETVGNRDRRDDKVKKPKKSDKVVTGRSQITEVPPPVEVVRKKRKETFPSDED